MKIGQDEWYPVYTLTKDDSWGEYPVFIPDDLIKRCEKAEEEFDVCQTELSKYYKKAKEQAHLDWRKKELEKQ